MYIVLGKFKKPLFEELRQTSQDFSESPPNSRKSRDVCPNSSKSGFPDFQKTIKTSREKRKLRKRIWGRFQSSPPPLCDRAGHHTPRHFNIMAYGWILGSL